VTPEIADPQRYRVNLICGCNNDLAYGYGATVEEARGNARTFFRRHHGRMVKIKEEIVEKVTDDGTHYEEVAR